MPSSSASMTLAFLITLSCFSSARSVRPYGPHVMYSYSRPYVVRNYGSDIVHDYDSHVAYSYGPHVPYNYGSCTVHNYPAPADTIQAIRLNGHAQGTTWNILYYSQDSLVTQFSIDSILTKLDSSLSLYKPYSLICRFNSAERSIQIDEHFKKVIVQSLDTWRQSGGLFDITIQPLVEAWGFSARRTGIYPDSQRVSSLLQCTGSGELHLQGQNLIKDRPCIKIDLDGIAQGYSVDVLADFLELHGITDYMVELGGEIRIRGRRRPSGERMRIGIEAPAASDFESPPMQRILCPEGGAFTTSGNYRAFHESKGKKFSHTIDPRTGFPSSNELISVTVYASRAIVADACDNVLMIMGLQAAMAFVEQHREMAAYFIYRRPDGSIADTATSRFTSLLCH